MLETILRILVWLVALCAVCLLVFVAIIRRYEVRERRRVRLQSPNGEPADCGSARLRSPRADA